MPRTIAIIPARAGSVQLPRKNRQRVGGRSLVERAIDDAVKSGRCTEVAVTTDDPLSARQARRLGATVINRPRSLAGPRVTTAAVVVHALRQLAHEGRRYDRVVVLQPTSPLRRPSDVTHALRLHDRSAGRNVIAIVALKGAHWAMRRRSDGRLVPLEAAELVRRRQDLGTLYVPNGAIYVVGAGRITRPWFADAVGFVMPRERSVDVDDLFDLRVARALVAKA